MDSIKLKAYGKINIGLDVINKLPNGYHEVKMVMQTVGIHDSIQINKTLQSDIKIITNLYYLPANENNLAYKAAKILFDEFDIKEGIKINMKKHIPVSAGMAGGSTDAAAVLYGVNKIFSLGLTIEELKERAVKIGADVPYCLVGGTALAEGIGEKITSLKSMPDCHILIAKPGFSVSTKHVYQNLKVHEINNHPDIDGIISGINNNDIKQIANKMGNVLENVTIKEHPQLEKIKKLMISGGALNSIMSGSGPTIFGLFDDEKLLKEAYQSLKKARVAKNLFTTGVVNTGGNLFERIKING